MRKDQWFIGILFIASVLLALFFGFRNLENDTLIFTILLYWFFSTVYFNLRYVVKMNKGATIDYGINYSLSIGIFAGPLGVLIYELLYHFSVYTSRKITKTADHDELSHTFYNVGTFTLTTTLAYWLFNTFAGHFSVLPLGFWILFILIMFITVMISDAFLLTVLHLLGEITNRVEAVEFFKMRSLTDTMKTALTNAFLLYLLFENHMELVFIFFIINYTINRSIAFKAKATQDRIERDQFEKMAYTDFLTSAYNRAFMNKRIEELAAQQSGENLGIILADLDNFKQINDAYNHHVGDQIIQHFVDLMRKHLGKSGEIFRSGGEEFTLFIYDKGFDETCELIEGLRTAIKEKPVLVDYSGEPVNVHYTSSFGLYYFQITDKNSIEKAHIHADDLLYDSKELGKNRLTVHHESS
ncbi:GGDEF domain-containing protein [Tenuibacillus multivorans]|uniref:Diguanylate cyclase (GGDEF) domain-containing protein n=1 Tax=Tenuibacillus multivorans TaxID=237069 RepID=A0A1G9WGW1_9BACI|nr:GGDEF domain-containing protein [Tenuibacillus multivorans]GEL76459.1 hypothetical protein TMU01_06940 [Tenuibacillus multivorans]SDM83720.1 diguanylate cyclase (GGDEF) domain-containing protein [Tenuibacillus multivorans]